MFAHAEVSGLVLGHVYLISTLPLPGIDPGYRPVEFLGGTDATLWAYLGSGKNITLSAKEVSERVFVLHENEWQSLKDGLEPTLIELQTCESSEDRSADWEERKRQLQRIQESMNRLLLAKPTTEQSNI
jgi:hypothetical protein